MKKTLILLFSLVSLHATPLGVLYETTNNIITPDDLKITNLTVLNATASKVTAFSAASKLVSTLLDTTKANILQSWVSGTNTLTLGGAQIISGDTAPTNGTTYVQRILYINANGTNLNDTYWGNYGANWYAIASTNGGSITEVQLNFNDNTTADSTTNKHGLLRKLSGNFTEYLSGDGVWRDPLSGLGSLTTGRVPVYSGLALANSDITTSILPAGDYGLISTRSWNVHNLKVTNNATLGTAIVTNFGGTTLGDVSITAHGLVPTAPNDATKFLNGLGAWAVPSGGSGSVGTSGSPSATQLAYFSGSSTIAGVPSSSVSVAGVSVPTLTTTTSLNINESDTTGNVRSGDYLPTLSNFTSCVASANQYRVDYHRIGSKVFVNGVIEVNRTGGGALVWNIDLPIASSDIVTGPSLSGYAVSSNGSETQWNSHALIEPSSGLAQFRTYDLTTSGGTVYRYRFNFSYTVR